MYFDGPVVMGIVNTTPDSFYSGSRSMSQADVLKKCEQHLSEGATILDIGGCSTRPGSVQVTEEEEVERVFPLFSLIRREFPETLLSIDTYRASVTWQAFQEGADIINDISAGSLDEKMIGAAGRTGLPYILTHMKGTPETMSTSEPYSNVTAEVARFFGSKVQELKSHGIHDIILDPGFGFGKSLQDNYQLLSELGFLSSLGLPVLAGVSRKGMIQKVLEVKAEDALHGTTVVNTMALAGGAAILRVHDSKPAAEAIRIFRYLKSW